MASACYVYAIVDRTATLPPDLTGLNGEPLSLVPWQELAAVVSGSVQSSIRPSADALTRHEAVVEALCNAMRSLPVRFGTLLPNDAGVAQALAGRYETLLSDLVRIGGNVELGLTVLWGSRGIQDDVDDGQLARDADHVEGQGRGTRYLLARREAYRRERAIHTTAQTVASELDRRLRPHVRESQYRVDTLPGLAVRAAYLVDRDMLAGARTALMECRRAYGELRFLVTGPWPPYSFVSPPLRQLEMARGASRQPEASTAVTEATMPMDACSYAKE
ncbi:MAG TPA: GvpL/GvpF family gas vesicle protein [Ktedonobacterales bacterium]|jgi:hypothetical protein|nr:GvpL/GvpF family gas vesicle protein [Ktedonobacterales bacterium]